MKTGREIYFKNRKTLNFLVKLFKFFPQSILQFLWNLTSMHSQIIFVGLRYIILKSRIKSCGDNVKIGTNVQIFAWEYLSIGSNVSIHSNCYIDSNGGIIIGNNVSVAHNSSILSTNHSWEDLSIPIKYNPILNGRVIIEDDVWIGCGCRILSNVTIKSRSIIAAGAVVNKDIQGDSLIGGVPAKFIKKL